MSEFEKNTIVIGVFANESAAVGAVAGLEHWADTRRDIKLGAIGAMCNEDGEISVELLREADQDGLVQGAVMLAKGLLGPLSLVGNVVSGVAQSLRRGSDQGIPESLQKLGEQLESGRVALVLVSDEEDRSAYGSQIEAMCGDVILHEVPQEILEEIAAAVEAAEAQKEAEEKAAKEAEKAGKKAEKEAEKAAKQAEREAEKAAKEAEKEAKKAAKEAEKEGEEEESEAES